jgi:S-adenosylmethionine:tRNA ribosyltransferase-isomerase
MKPFPFDYTLPPALIAQQPCEPRDHARLLVARRFDGALAHRHFYDLPDLLNPGDLLVLNDTRVVPARLLGRRARTGGKWEGLFVRELPDTTWEMLCQTRGTLKEGEVIDIEPGPLQLELTQRLPMGRWIARPLPSGSTIELLERFGTVPLPPYIRKGAAKDDDRQRYQTIYAQRVGAVAAPTAGLHFTQRVFDRLRDRGIGWTTVTLHVGLATFQPIQVDDYTQHPIHSEWCEITQSAADAVNACKSRIVAVGTTSVRVLESVAQMSWPQDTALANSEPARSEFRRHVQGWTGETNCYIHPPYAFKIVDALVTNLHLPRTTLLLLVAAFAGVDLVRNAYQSAIAERYRFYSYGDAMLIV